MKLGEFNEAYEEYILTEEYLAEGLKVFKKSKKLFKVADKLKRVGEKKNDKGKINLSKKISNLANSFKEIEDSFASKKINKANAKTSLLNLKAEQASVMKDAKKELGTNKKIIAGALSIAVLAALAAVAINPGLITSVTSAISAGKGKLLSLFSKGVPSEIANVPTKQVAAKTVIDKTAEEAAKKAAEEAAKKAAEEAAKKAAEEASRESSNVVRNVAVSTRGRETAAQTARRRARTLIRN